MACGCQEACTCFLDSSDTVAVSGGGSSASHWIPVVLADPVGGLTTGVNGVGILIDPASSLPYSFSAAGLLLECCPAEVMDSDTIDFSITGGAVTGDVIPDPDGGLENTAFGVAIKPDPASPATVSVSAAGIAVACCATPTPTPGVQVFTATDTIDEFGGEFVTFAGAAGQTLTLPAATLGLSFDIMNLDTVDSVTIAPDGSDVINPAALTSIVMLPGARASFICISAGVWNCSLSASVTTSSGGAAMGSIVPTAVLTLTLGPGKWNLQGKAYWDVSTVAPRTYLARLYDTTAAVEIDRHEKYTASVLMKSAVTLQQEISLLTTSVIEFQVAPDVLDGSQLLQDPVFTAVAIDG